MKHPGRIEFYYPDEGHPVFSNPLIELSDIGGSAITDGVEIALGRALLDFNESVHAALTGEMYASLTGEDNARYDAICRDRAAIRENIGEINYVMDRAVRARSN